MRKILLLCFSLLLLSCKQKESKTIQKKMNTFKAKDSNNGQSFYKLKLSCSLPYKLLLNDLILDQDSGEEGGAVDTNLFINNFILSSGQQTLKLLVKPKKGKDSISKRSLEFITIKVVKVNSLDSRESDLIDEFTISKAIHAGDNVYLWDFLSETEYNLDGWSESVNLIHEDKEKLLKEILLFYEDTHSILNSGNVDGYLNLVKRRNEETAIAFHNAPEIKNETQELKVRVKEAKGKMNPLENFVLKFYANGKIVTLENQEGDSPLNYSTEEFDDFFSIQLHRPEKDGLLEVIR